MRYKVPIQIMDKMSLSISRVNKLFTGDKNSCDGSVKFLLMTAG